MFNSELTVRRVIKPGEDMTISFSATTEFDSKLKYQLLVAPDYAYLNEMKTLASLPGKFRKP